MFLSCGKQGCYLSVFERRFNIRILAHITGIKTKYDFSKSKSRASFVNQDTREMSWGKMLPQDFTLLLPCSRKASPAFGWFSLHLPMEGRPGWVNLGGWLHTEIGFLHRDQSPIPVRFLELRPHHADLSRCLNLEMTPNSWYQWDQASTPDDVYCTRKWQGSLYTLFLLPFLLLPLVRLGRIAARVAPLSRYRHRRNAGAIALGRPAVFHFRTPVVVVVPHGGHILVSAAAIGSRSDTWLRTRILTTTQHQHTDNNENNDG